MASHHGEREEVYERSLAHLLRRLEECPEHDEPYSHFYLTEAFPPDVYEQMMRRYPDRSQFSCAESHDYGGGNNRFLLHLEEHRASQLPSEISALWTGIADVLGSDELRVAVYRKLKRGLMHRFGVNESGLDALPGVACPRIYSERSGYAIPPHPDTRKKVVTFQFALPETDEQQDLGTGIYQRSLNPKDWIGQPKGFRGFKKVGQYPFLPNTAFGFCVLNTMSMKSWHGREPLGADAGERRSILNVYYVNEAVADGPVARRRAA